MKKVGIVTMVLAVSLVFVGSVFAAGQAHMNTGCGVGTMIFQNSADDSIMLQTTQGATNNSFGNAFSITSGTSECEQPKNFVENERTNEFVLANLDNLAKDIAAGKGETLDAIAELMGIPFGKRDEFARKLQASFGKIYTSDQVVYANVVDNIVAVNMQ